MIEFALAADMIFLLCVGDTKEEGRKREKEGRKEGGDVWLSSLPSACKAQALCGTMFPGSVKCRWHPATCFTTGQERLQVL